MLGGGQAAFSFANRFREQDSTTEVMIIGQENFLPYQRPPLSKKYLKGELVVSDLTLRPKEWYSENNIKCLIGVRAVQIDAIAKKVVLHDGRTIDYGKLVLTLGASSRMLPASAGPDLEGVFCIRDINDVDHIRRNLKPGIKVLVVGGGFIGLEASAILSDMADIRVVEMSDRILQRVVCSTTSDYFRELHKQHGVVISENLSLLRLIGKNNRVCGAELSNGEIIDVDLVLVGIGSIPNDKLAADAGIEANDGILVDKYGRTNAKDVYAAGDCARFDHNGHSIRLESVQNAVDQSECVAINILGNESNYSPIPWFWSDQYKSKLQIYGLNIGYDRTVEKSGSKPSSKSIWYFRENRLLAVDAINDPRSFILAKKIIGIETRELSQDLVEAKSELESLAATVLRN